MSHNKYNKILMYVKDIRKSSGSPQTLFNTSEVEHTDRADLISNQRLLSHYLIIRSQCSPPAARLVLSLTSECEQCLWRPRHVINHQVERLKVVEERGRPLIHGHVVNDLQSQWKTLLITELLITNPSVHLRDLYSSGLLIPCYFTFTMLL